jgi:hypothetical protein
MCKVVAKWKGWESAVLHDEVGHFGIVYPLFYRVAYRHQPSQSCRDPRTDTDAALELLHHLDMVLGVDRVPTPTGYRVYRWREKIDIPTSGEPFRRAVCWLACDVLGVDDDTD